MPPGRRWRARCCRCWPPSLSIGFIAAAQPTITEAVRSARTTLDPGGRVAVASYLLAPGHFQDILARCRADLVAQPLGDHTLVAEIVADRFAEAVGA